MRNWTLHIRFTKGATKYADQRTAPILPPARAAVLRFLKKRGERLRALGIESDILIPAYYKGETKPYSEASLRGIVKMVNLRLDADPRTRGISFSLKDLRASYCQINIDRHPELLSEISYTIGHASTRTTEAFYGRIKQESALDHRQKAWENWKINSPKMG